VIIRHDNVEAILGLISDILIANDDYDVMNGDLQTTQLLYQCFCCGVTISADDILPFLTTMLMRNNDPFCKRAVIFVIAAIKERIVDIETFQSSTLPSLIAAKIHNPFLVEDILAFLARYSSCLLIDTLELA
jgi:hypothetical protein